MKNPQVPIRNIVISFIIPALKWKIPFIALYAVLMFLQWFGLPPYYTPYRFLYHAVLGTALMFFTEVIIKHAVKVRKI